MYSIELGSYFKQKLSPYDKNENVFKFLLNAIAFTFWQFETFNFTVKWSNDSRYSPAFSDNICKSQTLLFFSLEIYCSHSQ